MPGKRARVVVGIDGSERSIPALRWAAYEALRHDAELVAVHAYGDGPRLAPYGPVNISLSVQGAAGKAIALLDRCVRAAFGDAPPVPTRTVCDSRHPVPALLDQSRGAAMLVLAARCDLAGDSLLLGPTARACLRRAGCPVVLLPAAVHSGPRVAAGV